MGAWVKALGKGCNWLCWVVACCCQTQHVTRSSPSGLSAGMPPHVRGAAQEFVAVAGAEAQRQAEPNPEKRKYPGGAFDPLGLSKDSRVCRALTHDDFCCS